MLIEQKLEQIKLSKVQRDVMNYIIHNKYNIGDMTVKEVAKATYTSTTTVIRLAQKLGYHGYEEFKKDYLDEVHYLDSHFNHIDVNYPFQGNEPIQRISGKITQLTIEAMQDTLSLIEHDTLQKAIQYMRESSTIHIAAISYNLLLAQIFRLDMMRIGKNINICDLAGEEMFLLGVVHKGDTVIFISYSGQIEKLCILAKILKQKEVNIIVISSLGDNELKRYADVCLNLSTREKLYSKIKGYTNEYSVKLWLDILYSCYFALEYDKNMKTRLSHSKSGEIGRTSQVDVLKEEA